MKRKTLKAKYLVAFLWHHLFFLCALFRRACLRMSTQWFAKSWRATTESLRFTCQRLKSYMAPKLGQRRYRYCHWPYGAHTETSCNAIQSNSGLLSLRTYQHLNPFIFSGLCKQAVNWGEDSGDTSRGDWHERLRSRWSARWWGKRSPKRRYTLLPLPKHRRRFFSSAWGD